MAVSFWVKLTLDVTWAWVALSLIRSIGKPPGNYWVYVNRAMQVRLSDPDDLLFWTYSCHVARARFNQLGALLGYNTFARRKTLSAIRCDPIPPKGTRCKIPSVSHQKHEGSHPHRIV